MDSAEVKCETNDHQDPNGKGIATATTFGGIGS